MVAKNKFPAYFFMIIFTFLIGFSLLFTKLALSVATPIEILAYRFTFSLITVCLLMLFKVVKINFNKANWKYYFIFAFFYGILFFTFQILGLQKASSAEGGILIAFSPVIIMILSSIFLKESTSLLQKIFIFTSVSGIIYIFIMKGVSFKNTNSIGLLLFFFSALSYSIYTVIIRSTKNKFSSMEISFSIFFISSIFYNAILLYQHIQNQTLSTYFLPLLNMQFLISVTYISIGCTFLSTIIMVYALSILEAYKVAVFTNISTIITIGAGTLFLNETLQRFHIVGSILILIGAIGTNITKRKRT